MQSRQRARKAVVALVATTALAALLAGLVLGLLVPPIVDDAAFRRDFFTSSGFAGLAAVVAAIVAYAATRQSVRSSSAHARADRELAERRDRKAQWWARAEWALNQITTGDAGAAVIGLGVLDALGASEWANEHEVEIVAVALDYALDVGASPAETTNVSGCDTSDDGWTSGVDAGTMPAGDDDA
ncbi:hypothetical protein [Agrococcus sp. KRD186]|uniref:hypothetical protein n=1 Tax=Agrococcus sp. KRD186 TaxID=2729730 RepID=UPI0019D256DB|nr:hypothetical protein [Agrococcus sp. KRD186]